MISGREFIYNASIAITLYALLFVSIKIIDILIIKRMISAEKRQNSVILNNTNNVFITLSVIALIKSFAYDLAFVPSSSMRPTLEAQEQILINKHHYGFKNPITNSTLVHFNAPERGDVVVFKYPLDTSMLYVKRVIGVPGDIISYADKELKINNMPITKQYKSMYTYTLDGKAEESTLNQYTENLLGMNHAILLNDNSTISFYPQAIKDFKNKQLCQYLANSFSCTVPNGHYFMMGDNRDNSADSRYWGFVAEDEIIGKAVLTLVNLNHFNRIGTSLE